MIPRLVLRACVVAAALLASGCADIDGHDVDECGNNVVELDAGEDCDLIADPALGDDLVCGPPDGGAQQCRYVCDGAECPTGWACEDDGICRPPSGTFEAEDDPVFRIAAEQIALYNLVGEDEAELVTRLQGDLFVFATDDEVFEPAIELTVPNIRGDLFFADIDDDEHVDVLAPAVSHALSDDAAPRVHVMRAEPERLVTAVAPQELAGARILAAVPVTVTADGGQAPLFAVRSADGGVALQVRSDDCGDAGDGSRLELGVSDDAALHLTVAPILGDVPHAIVSVAGTSTVTVVSLTTPCSTAPAVVATVGMPSPATADGCTSLDMDGDADLDLLCHVAEGLAVASNDAGVLTDASPAGPGFDALDDLPAGQPRACAPNRRILAAADLDADGDTDLVTPHGVFMSTGPGTFNRVYARESGDAWGEVVAGDFDRDGRDDLVASILRDDAECAPVQLTALTEAKGSYSPRLVQGGSLAHDLVVADFDGDDIDDLAAVRPEADETRIAVFFGDTKEALEDATSVGGFSSVTALVALRSRRDAPINPDQIGDLAIVSEDGEFITLATGTTHRAFLSPLAPAPAPPGLGHRHAHVLAGPLTPTPDDVPPATDVLALFGTTAWLYRGDDVHHGDDPVALSLDGTGLRTECATWARGGPAPGGALIVGVDGHRPRTAEVDVPCDLQVAPSVLLGRIGGSADAPSWTAEVVTGLPGRRPTAVFVVDFDQSGREDVLIRFAQTDSTTRGAVLWLRDPEPGAVPDTLESLAPELDILAAALIDADADPAEELALWTPEGLRLVDYDPSGEAKPTISEVVLDAPRALGPGDAVSLVSGDLDGDALDDLALLLGDAVYLYPAVPRP